MKINKSIEKINLAVCAALLLLIGANLAAAQGKTSPIQSSFARAKQIFDAGVAALGGMENIRRADKIAINYRAVNHPLGQNLSFAAPLADVPRTGAKTLIDYSGGRYITEGQTAFAGGYKFNFRVVVSPKRSFSLDLLKNRRGNEVRNLDERGKTQNKIGLLMEVPHLLFLYAAQRPETLRWVGENQIDGQKLQSISFTTELGMLITLYLDAQTHLLVRTEQIGSDSQLGDVVSGNIFSNYQALGNVKIPGKRVSFYNQYLTSENEYADVKFDFAEGEKLLEVPAGFVEAPPSSQATAAKAEPAIRMGNGVYLIEQFGYRVMFAEFDNYIVVLETPTNDAIAKAEIQIIKQTIPNKPIKYVSFSHFHFDHTGGLREYIAEGATIVVPPGNRQFVESIAKSIFTVKPDTLALKPRPPVIETFEKKRVFTDGKRTLELYSIGPVSHVADMTMFYFPNEKILFQGDMFSQLDVGGIPPIIEINYELVKKVDDLKLNIETLIGVHSGNVRWQDFRAAVDNSKK